MIVELKKLKLSKSIINQSAQASLEIMLNLDGILGWISIQYKNKMYKQILFYDNTFKRLFVQYYPNQGIIVESCNDGNNQYAYRVKYKYYNNYLWYNKYKTEEEANQLLNKLQKMLKMVEFKGQVYY